MKFLRTLIILAFVIFYPNTSNARERILNYHSDIVIHEDGKIDVSETIIVFAEHNNINLGIYRDIPKTYRMDGKTYKTPIEVLYVERDDMPENFWVENKGGYKRIQIGPKNYNGRNKVPYGVNKYKIRWISDGHLREFTDYDELYFNVTGNAWGFDIEKASATVYLPENINIKQTASYHGASGSVEKSISSSISNNIVSFKAPTKLFAGEGLTIAVGFSKGIEIKHYIDKINNLLGKIVDIGYPYISPESASLIIIGMFLFIYYIVLWSIWGRDESLGIITPSYNPPKNISPATASVIWNGKNYSANKTFFASLISMASQRQIKIGDKSIEKAGVEYKSTHFKEEQEIYDTMFSKTDKIDMGKYNSKMNSAFNKFSAFLSQLKMKYIITHNKAILYGIILQVLLFFIIPYGTKIFGIFAAISFLSLFYSPFYFAFISLFRAKQYAGGMITAAFVIPHSLVFLTVFPASFFANNGNIELNLQYFVFLGISILTIFLHFIFYRLMDKPNPEAVKMLKDLAGLKMFMDAAEKDRYQKVTPSIFEKNLPYAIIFGIESKWFDKIKEIYPTYTPEWYSGRERFSSSSLSRMHSGLSTASIPAIKSSRGGSGGGFSSSGSGGGGSSGGGSGGGGGGGR